MLHRYNGTKKGKKPKINPQRGISQNEGREEGENKENIHNITQYIERYTCM